LQDAPLWLLSLKRAGEKGLAARIISKTSPCSLWILNRVRLILFGRKGPCLSWGFKTVSGSAVHDEKIMATMRFSSCKKPMRLKNTWSNIEGVRKNSKRMATSLAPDGYPAF
jgi:hypothetical protein